MFYLKFEKFQYLTCMAYIGNLQKRDYQWSGKLYYQNIKRNYQVATPENRNFKGQRNKDIKKKKKRNQLDFDLYF